MLELTLRIGFSLLVVFGLMWGLAKVARRPLAGRGGAALSVVARQQLSRSASVAVVRLGERALVVGVTDHQVSLLAETDLAALEQPAASADVREPVALDAGTLDAGTLDGKAAEGGALDGTALDGVPAQARWTGTAAQVAPAGRLTPGADGAGRLAGSVLSPDTWRQTVDFLRERTVRR